LVALIAVWLGYLIVNSGMAAAAIEQGNPQRALQLRPNSPRALSLESEQSLARQSLVEAGAAARAALVNVPRDVRALRVLGIVSSLSERPRLGSELLLRSGILSWRDPVTQVWLISAAMDQNNFATATQRTDAMLRVGELVPEMMRLMHELAAAPDARPFVIERLAEGPQWRRAFFVNSEYLPDGAIAGHAQLIEDMRTHGEPVSREELAYFLGHLVRKKQYALAQSLWLAKSTDRPISQDSAVFDGDFEQDPTAEGAQPRYPFEWQFATDSGNASLGTPPLLIGQTALMAEAGDTREPLASQMILLRPGRHSLSYDVTGDGHPAFRWRIRCEATGSVLPLSSQRQRTVGSWRTAVMDFDVPAGCPAQWLELIAHAGPGETGVRAWFDRVSVR
jgi:hypothetical protein